MIRRPPRSTLFPTRRSSDLGTGAVSIPGRIARMSPEPGDDTSVRKISHFRSEEHTSELQSQSNLVCRLLLEKKKEEVIRQEQETVFHKIDNHIGLSDADMPH